QESLLISPHCLGYELSQCGEEPSHFILRIEWDSHEGHLKGFRQSAEFRPFLIAVQPFVGDIEEMRHYEVTRVRRQGGRGVVNEERSVSKKNPPCICDRHDRRRRRRGFRPAGATRHAFASRCAGAFAAVAAAVPTSAL